MDSPREHAAAGWGEEKQGVSGRVVFAAVCLTSIVVVAVGLLSVRPERGVQPVPVDQRPFGPANDRDFAERPLIRKGQTFERERLLADGANVPPAGQVRD